MESCSRLDCLQWPVLEFAEGPEEQEKFGLRGS